MATSSEVDVKLGTFGFSSQGGDTVLPASYETLPQKAAGVAEGQTAQVVAARAQVDPGPTGSQAECTPMELVVTTLNVTALRPNLTNVLERMRREAD
eukprot:2784529-Alexandrium_andersonii.AAC.1